MVDTWSPWAVLAAYALLIWIVTPTRVSPRQFFGGSNPAGGDPRLWLLAASAAISWVFSKSVANAADLGADFGLIGGVGYTLYYLSFVTAAVAIWFIRTRGGHRSLPGFLTHKYGATCARLFLVAIAIRLFNEVWSNTKVSALYFGAEGTGGYWVAALAVTAFTVYYTLRGGLRSSLLTDGVQMVMAAALLVLVLIAVGPGLSSDGLPAVDDPTRLAGLTFCGLALVQVLSYPFHDPVLTDRAFITTPRTMVRGFLLAGVISGAFIFLFSAIGLYARNRGIGGDPYVTVPAALGLPILLVVNAIMLTSAGSTLDSTLSSGAKLAARDWSGRRDEATPRQVTTGQWVMVTLAVLGNLPLLSVYLGDQVGPAIIAATTISGTMVMGLAPIFLLSFLPRAGRRSFHLAFWPGLVLGTILAVETITGDAILPSWIDVGSGDYADDLGANLWGLGLCTAGYLAGALWPGRSPSEATQEPEAEEAPAAPRKPPLPTLPRRHPL